MNGKWVLSSEKLPPVGKQVLTYSKYHGYQILQYTDRWKTDHCVLRNDPNDAMASWRGWYDDHDWKVTSKIVMWFDGELPTVDEEKLKIATIR